MDLSTDQVLAECDASSGVATIVLNNPTRHNAMTGEMFEALAVAAEAFDADDAVKVIVVRGAGEKAFVSGADIGQLGSRPGPSRETRSAPPAGGTGGARDDREARDDRGALALLSIEKPVVAMIHGYCIGAGLLLAMAADLRISADDGQFAIPAGRLGVGYPAVGMRMLTDLVGPGKASEIVFTANRYSAAEALAMGLVNRVVPKAELEAAVAELTATIAVQAPLSLRAAKASIKAVARGWAPDDVAVADAAVRRCWTSDDFVEGRRAFAEKRSPVFRGR